MPKMNDGVVYWNQRYADGGYEGEPPVPFVDDITLAVQSELGPDAHGLYVGCGDGRNYIPLIDKGLDVFGIDFSGQAIRRLRKQRPDLRTHSAITDFRGYEPEKPLDFLIALQVFQHGNDRSVIGDFERSHSILRTGGLFFLRVNAASTQIVEPHEKYPTNEHGAFSVRYTGKHKQNMQIHFYTEPELAHIAETTGFEVVGDMREAQMDRDDGTHWTQLETTWRAV